MGKQVSRQRGFTLFETLIAVGILGIFFVAIVYILQQILTNVGESRLRTTALTLVQSRMETIHNLPYLQVGTVGGIPAGPIAPSETAIVNSQSFTITTSIIYIDDPFDQTAPQDTISTDYKRVRLSVTWGGVYPARTPVTLVTNIAPKGTESTLGGGTLFLQVFNALGQPVPNATVTITNTQVNPVINMQTLSNNDGVVTLPGAPACVTCYQISVTKANYSSDRTYSSTEVANPLQPYATVIAGSITQLSFSIDAVSTLIVNSYGAGPLYPIATNVLFTLRGSKIIGYTTTDEPVYKYSYSTNTGGGSVSIPSLEWDTYTLDFANSAHNLAGSNPIQPLTITPGTAQTVRIVAVPKTNTSLLVIIQNAAHQLQASASAQLTNTQLSYDASASAAATGSADFGQVFFGGLTPETYQLKVTLPGYQEATTSVVLSSIHQETVTLNQNQ
jgi:prepilin-type N-terminal cleavage/methylation domain-containing protein